MTSRLLAACGAALVALAGVALCDIQGAAAASAVTVHPKSGAFGFCTGADDPYAALMCARKKCEAAGGRDCQSIAGCPTQGHGAVARDRGARVVGASCGKKTVAEARTEAMQACVAQSGANCKIVELFSDAGGTSAAVDTGQAAKASAASKLASAPKTAVAAPDKPAPAQSSQASASRKAPSAAAAPPAAAAPQPVKPPTKLLAATPPASDPASMQPAAGPSAKQSAAVPPARTAETSTDPSSLKPQDKSARDSRTQSVVDDLRARSERRQQALAPTTEEQIKRADMLLGVWSSQKCAEKFWRITKAGNKNYNVLVWHEDGQENTTSFRVTHEADVMVLTWNTRLPNAIENLKKGRRYVEKIGTIRDDSYTVVENNYKDFKRSWTVRRCTQKR